MNIEQPKIDEDLDFTTPKTQGQNISYEDTIEGCTDILNNLYKKLEELEVGKITSEEGKLIIDINSEIKRLEEKRRLLKTEESLKKKSKYDLDNEVEEARKTKEEADAELFEKTLIRDGTRNKF